ncbi:MAG TPA: hypothetical protein VHO06_15340 [Polyangia bacterium]|nr:hypothetical protein [Polyangia bacterium]
MNRRAWVWGLALLAVGALACTKLIAGRCEVDGDCGNSRMVCNAMKTCVPKTDGGAAGAGGQGGAAGSKGTGGTPFSCATAKCDPTTPICDVDAGKCRACNVEGATACGDLDAGTPVCAPGDAGALAGSCVGCLDNGDCHGTKPICDVTNHTCIACGSDGDCKGVGPGVCMTDGHCASDAETIYVRGDPGTCSDTPSASDGGSTAGTKAHPFCSLQPVPTFVSSGRTLVVVDGSSGIVTGGTWSYADQCQPGQLSIVGQNNAKIGSVSTPVFSMGSGTVSIRSVTFSLSASLGINATGGTLTLNDVTVDSCMGGGISLSGTTFHIENTTVTNDGPGANGTSGGMNITTAGTGSTLDLVTIEDNKPIGISCDGPIDATGIYVMANTGGQIATSCNLSSCPAPGSGCGAQP